MASQDLIDIMRRAESLSLEEQLHLIAHLAERTAETIGGAQRRYNWLDIAGAAPYPLVGEDAQAWVSRTRRESDESRERALKRPL